MPDFQLTSTVPHDGLTVRALLTAWQVPKTRQHELRVGHDVRINGDYLYFNTILPAGATVTLTIHDETPPQYVLDPTPLTVVYEDQTVLVVSKPAGIKAHPNQPGENGSLMNRVAAYLAPHPAYITHRLDMATSGLMLVAKDPLSQALIDRQLANKTMRRDYVALTQPGLPTHGQINDPIGRDPADKRKRRIDPTGLPARTFYRVLATSPTHDRLSLTLATGRTHQLRVHLAALGYPILGDPLYSQDNSPLYPRLALHATRLTWLRPLTTDRLTVDDPAPF